MRPASSAIGSKASAVDCVPSSEVVTRVEQWHGVMLENGWT
jgi:hypothetical protein